LSEMPYWPRYLSREQAARYLGVSPDTFDGEVQNGLWPPARRRGGKGGRLTWDRRALDAAADRDSGLTDLGQPVPPLTGVWGARSRDETNKKRAERRPKAAG
jgi:hypothetical protein